MTRDQLGVLDKVDVTSHHDQQGKLYMPSYPWGIYIYPHDCMPSNGQPHSDSARTRGEAVTKASKAHHRGKNTSVLVFRRKDGVIVERFFA